MNLSQEALKQLICDRCHLYLSVGPVTTSTNNNFLCGRCSSGGAQVRIYELLAKSFSFPCRYRSFGCLELIKWDSVTLHERNCTKKPQLCAAVPPGICLWRGAPKDVAEHFKENHAEDVTDKNVIELKLHDNLEGCKMIEIQKRHYVFHVYFNREQKLLKLNFMQLGSLKREMYQLTLHCHDFSKHITLAADSVQTYGSMDHNNIKDDNIVDLSVLKFLTNDKPSIFCEITLLQATKEKVNSELFKLLECPVCHEYMCSPIYQCRTGHSFCSACISKLKICPLCHKELTETRNYVLEDLVNQVSHHCKNKHLGCNFSGPMEEIKLHEQTCYFYTCPLKTSQKCPWSGNLEKLIEHCKKTHVYLESESYGLVCSLTVDKHGVFRLIYSDSYFFKICRRYTNEEFSVVIQFVGPNDKAAEYLYEFSFVQTDCDQANLSIKNVCQALTDDESAFDNCIKIPYSLLVSFVKNNKLNCNIKILKKQDILTEETNSL